MIEREISPYRLQNIPHVISLGAGVQSSTMLFMAAAGELTPMPKAAIFADTQQEPKSVYRWIDFLLSREWPFPILVRTKGNLGTASLARHRSKKLGNNYIRMIIPTYIKKPDGSRGVLARRCTGDYKIRVVEKALRREVLKRRAVPTYISLPIVCSWIGISTDEADRMKPSRLPWIINRWPLIESEISREGCRQWMSSHSLPDPPRSACKQCPYHSDAEWLRLAQEEPEDFAEAVQWERDYQTALVEHDDVTEGVPFLHNSLIPLDQIKFNPNGTRSQFSNECEGMCGV